MTKECKETWWVIATCFAIVVTLMALLTGCVNTITHYDKDGKITKVEKVTNTSRMFDGTNGKSQMVLIDGTYVKSDVSMTAGESYTPGWTITFANGKSAVINSRDKAKYTNVNNIVEKFFQNIEMSKDGIKTNK